MKRRLLFYLPPILMLLAALYVWTVPASNPIRFAHSSPKHLGQVGLGLVVQEAVDQASRLSQPRDSKPQDQSSADLKSEAQTKRVPRVAFVLRLPKKHFKIFESCILPSYLLFARHIGELVLVVDAEDTTFRQELEQQESSIFKLAFAALPQDSNNMFKGLHG